MHVFSDLMPYICTFDGCPHKLRCFPSRSAWANHEFQEHRFDRHWACPECPRESCSTLDWEHHLNNVHSQKFSGPNLVSARNTACRIKPKRAEEEECPLCRVVLGKPRRAFVRHVSRHMEDIALMALPSNAEENPEIGSISTNHTSNEDNDTSNDVHIDEESTIKCICGFKYDDGNTVYCERCDTWQHTECYYPYLHGVVPTKDVLSSIDHFCVKCKYRPLDYRAANERQVNRRQRADFGSIGLWMQPNEQESNAPPENQTARMMSPFDTSDVFLTRESPQVERTTVNAQPSPSPDYDAVVTRFMRGLKHPDLASKAGEYPLYQESEAWRSAFNDIPARFTNDFTEMGVGIPLSTPGAAVRRNSVLSSSFPDPTSSSSVDSLGWRKLVGKTIRKKRSFTPAEKVAINAKRKTGACNDCRKAKRKVSALTGWGIQYCG